MSEPANADTQREAARAQPVPLRLLQRWLLGILGLGTLAAGAVAVFRANDGTGALGLLICGLALIVLTLVGSLPSRFRFGEAEIEWQQRARVAEKALADVAGANPNSPEGIQQAVERARNVVAQLRSGELRGADLRFADLTDTDLRGSRLTGGPAQRDRIHKRELQERSVYGRGLRWRAF